jgi:Ni,Fe-hydrogenase III component G
MPGQRNNPEGASMSRTEILLNHIDKVVEQLHKKDRQTLKEIATASELSEGDVRFALRLLMSRERRLVVATTYGWESGEDLPTSARVEVR